jgi:hypothetical protein
MTELSKIRSIWRHKKKKSKGHSKALWFRGQRSMDWGLRPRFYRREYKGAFESEIRLEFEGSGLQLSTTNLNRSKWEWYFLMQHYGAPTRLLDWTGNPLVALYFAIVEHQVLGKDRDAAVWVFDPWRWNKLNSEGLHGPALPDWKEASPYLPDLEDACDGVRVEKRWPIALEPPSIDRRLASQTARFLLFGREKDLLDAANKTDSVCPPRKQCRLAQIIIGRKKLEPLRHELDDLGINHRVLFPDMAGLGAHLSWEWKRFPSKKRLY